MLTLLFVLLNPVLFSPPEDDSAWMTKVVYGERLWTQQPHGRHGYPEILNLCNGLAALYALSAAVRQRPAETALATARSMALKL